MKQYIGMVRHCQMLTNVPASLKPQIDSLDEAMLSLNGSKTCSTIRPPRQHARLVLFDAFSWATSSPDTQISEMAGCYLDKISAWIDVVSHVDALVSMATFRYNHPRQVMPKSSSQTKSSMRHATFIIRSSAQVLCATISASSTATTISSREPIWRAKVRFCARWAWTISSPATACPCSPPAYACRGSRCSVACAPGDDLPMAFLISMPNCWGWSISSTIVRTAPVRWLSSMRYWKAPTRWTNSTGRASSSSPSRGCRWAAWLPPTTWTLKMADEYPDRFHNYCFEIELGADVTYSYKITPGVARNQNATFLLKTYCEVCKCFKNQIDKLNKL